MRELKLGDNDHRALAELDTDTETTRTEWAVLYPERGRIVASGPYPHQSVAQSVAERQHGRLLSRTVQVTHGDWTAA